ncbi:MAG: DMT family transporter [Patescibacteria group bacterium]
MNTYKRGLIYAFAASFISGISIWLNKYALGTISSPVLLTTSKNILVGVAFLSLLIIAGKLRKIFELPRKDLLKLVLISLVGGSIPFYLFFSGLASTSAINAAIIQKTLVIWVAVFATYFLKEKISVLGVLAVTLLFLGNIHVGGFKGFSFSNGEVMILVATFLWAIESILAKKVLKNIEVEIVAAFRMGLGSVVLLSLMLIQNTSSILTISSFGYEQYLWLGITAVLLFGYVYTWYKAVSMAPVVAVTSVLVVSTLITNVLSAVFVTHTWTEGMMTQAAILAIGVLLAYAAFNKLDLKQKENIVADGRA